MSDTPARAASCRYGRAHSVSVPGGFVYYRQRSGALLEKWHPSRECWDVDERGSWEARVGDPNAMPLEQVTADDMPPESLTAPSGAPGV